MTSTYEVRTHLGVRGSESRFRPDIEGLRAIAIGSVLLYHAGVGFLHGGFVGVDVFFVISGFLITSHLLREIESSGRFSLAGFYGRRMRRLMPAAVLVLAVTTLITRLTVPNVGWRPFGGDIVAAAGYLLNWRLADRSVDYLAEGTQVSPVQHFWSLSVEEQFYVVWPLLLIGVAFLVRRLRWRVAPTAAVALALVAVPSFLWSVHFTAQSRAAAFFVTPTRLWELAVGGACAIGIGAAHRLPRAAAVTLGWLGLTAIVASLFVADASSMWPGWLAAVPVLGTAAIIVAGGAWRDAAPRFLSARPMIGLGALSYSLYLWHWPLLIGERNLAGHAGVWTGLLVVAFSFVPAWLCYRYVEQPTRRSRLLARPRRAVGLGLVASAAAASCGLVLITAVPAFHPGTVTVAGAKVLSQHGDRITGVQVVDSFTKVAPLPANAADDSPSAYHKSCVAYTSDVTPKVCQYGDPAGSPSVYLIGDSKALQWITPVNKVAKKHGWNLKLAVKLACPIAGVLIEYQGPFKQCQQYARALRDDLVRARPDVVIVSQGNVASAYDRAGTLDHQTLIDGYVDTWKTLQAQGTRVILLSDVPTGGPYVPGRDLGVCVAEHMSSLGSCAFSRSKAVASSGAPIFAEAASHDPGAELVDMTDALCNRTSCPAVIGGNLVYRQGAHLTNSFARSLAPFLDARIAPLVERSR
ncbi:MAG: acyltransferase family protein [Nocardioides sp.]